MLNKSHPAQGLRCGAAIAKLSAGWQCALAARSSQGIWLQQCCMQFTQACRSSCCLSPFCTDASWRCDRADLCNEAAVVNITAGQQHVEAGQVSVQDVHAMQMGHAACYLPDRCQNRRQVWQAMHGRPVGAEPASVNAILPKQKATFITSVMPHFV